MSLAAFPPLPKATAHRYALPATRQNRAAPRPGWCGGRLRPLATAAFAQDRRLPPGNCLTPAIEPASRLPLHAPFPPARRSIPRRLPARFNFGDRPGGNAPVMVHAFAVNPASCAR